MGTGKALKVAGRAAGEEGNRPTKLVYPFLFLPHFSSFFVTGSF